jgi:hypothetical protein
MPIVTLPTEEIRDQQSFHTVCQRVMGFPAFYGRNMNAWIDCLSYLDEGGAGMSAFTVHGEEHLIVEIPGAEALRERAPDVFQDMIECTAFVNQRYVTRGRRAPIALVLC